MRLLWFKTATFGLASILSLLIALAAAVSVIFLTAPALQLLSKKVPAHEGSPLYIILFLIGWFVIPAGLLLCGAAVGLSLSIIGLAGGEKVYGLAGLGCVLNAGALICLLAGWMRFW